jgi:hypothetical protein
MNPARLIAPLLLSSSAAATTSLELGTAWQSKYVSEGRDNLDGHAFLLSTATLTHGQFDAEVAYGLEDRPRNLTSERYREWNAGVGFGNELGPVDWHASYKHLWLPASEERDNEWALALSTTSDSNLTASLAYTYATTAGGGFYEAALEYELSCGATCQLTSYLIASDNRGYIAGGERGPNNVQAGLSLLAQADTRVTIVAELNYSRPFDDAPAQGLTELFWWNLALRFRLF